MLIKTLYHINDIKIKYLNTLLKVTLLYSYYVET